MIVKMHVRLLLQSADARLDFFARVYGVTLDAAFKRFDVRSCFTEQTQNIRSECDPAPSPPPPNNWLRPPSPPAFVYEVITLATATGSSATFFIISAVCCFAVGGHAARSRQKSRMLGTRGERGDEMPWKMEEAKRRGEAPTGPFRPEYRQPAAQLATGFSFKGMSTRYNPVNSL